MSQTRQRLLFALMLLLGLASPLAVLLPVLVLPESALSSMSEPVGIALVLCALLIPLVFLYLAARFAVRGSMSGVWVLGSWWMLNVIAAFGNQGSGQPANALVKALTLGVVTPSTDGLWSMPGPLLALGTSRSFSAELPIYVLFLMGAYTGIKQREMRLARATEHTRPYSAVDESGG